MLHIDNCTELYSNEDFINAAIQLIGQASRYLRIRSAILDPDLFDNREMNSALSAFARKSRHAQIQILLDKPGSLLQFDHSSIELIRRLGEKIIVKEFYEKPEFERETTIISDNRGVLVKYPTDGQKGYFSLTDTLYTEYFRESFEYEWDRSTVAHQLRGFTI